MNEIGTKMSLNLESVDKLNETFLTLNSSNYESVVEAAKVVYLLNPAQNQRKALDLLTNVNSFKSNLHVRFQV